MYASSRPIHPVRTPAREGQCKSLSSPTRTLLPPPPPQVDLHGQHVADALTLIRQYAHSCEVLPGACVWVCMCEGKGCGKMTLTPARSCPVRAFGGMKDICDGFGGMGLKPPSLLVFRMLSAH